jgi:integrase
VGERESELKRKIKEAKLDKILNELGESGTLPSSRLPYEGRFNPHQFRHTLASSFIRDMAKRQTEGEAEEKE